MLFSVKSPLIKLSGSILMPLAIMPPTLMTESLPNTTPLAFTNITWPLASIRPRILLPLLLSTRLSAIDDELGWINSTRSLAATSKLRQSMAMRSLACWINVSTPVCVIVPSPATTSPPSGAACKCPAAIHWDATNIAAYSLRRDRCDCCWRDGRDLGRRVLLICHS